MNQHVRDIRTMLDEVGEKKGKYFGLSAQLYSRDTIWKEKGLELTPEGRKRGGTRKSGRRYSLPFFRGAGYTHLDSRRVIGHTDCALSHN